MRSITSRGDLGAGPEEVSIKSGIRTGASNEDCGLVLADISGSRHVVMLDSSGGGGEGGGLGR